MKDALGHGSDARGAANVAVPPATVEALRANVRAATTGHYHSGLKRAVHRLFGASHGGGSGGSPGSGGGGVEFGGGRPAGGQGARQVAKRHGIATKQLDDGSMGRGSGQCQ